MAWKNNSSKNGQSKNEKTNKTCKKKKYTKKMACMMDVTAGSETSHYSHRRHYSPHHTPASARAAARPPPVVNLAGASDAVVASGDASASGESATVAGVLPFFLAGASGAGAGASAVPKSFCGSSTLSTW